MLAAACSATIDTGPGASNPGDSSPGGSNPAGGGSNPGGGGSNPGGGSNSGLDAGNGGTGNSLGTGPTDAGPVNGARCTNPTCSGVGAECNTSASGTVSQASGWDVYDNQWSCNSGPCLNETIDVCSTSSWYVTSNLPAANTAVLTYAASQVNFNQVPLSSFKTITSTFKETSPHNATAPAGSANFGDYEAAYDVFFGPNNDNEIMVWVDNNGQTPAGGWNPVASNVTIGGTVWNVYFAGTTTSWVAQTNFTSGSVDLLSIFLYTTNTLHEFSATAAAGYLNQIQFGWELCSTNGTAETFYLDELSVTST
jgi:hypothetical protein